MSKEDGWWAGRGCQVEVCPRHTRGGACAEATAAVCVGPVDQASPGYVQRWRAKETARAARWKVGYVEQKNEASESLVSHSEKGIYKQEEGERLENDMRCWSGLTSTNMNSVL